MVQKVGRQIKKRRDAKRIGKEVWIVEYSRIVSVEQGNNKARNGGAYLLPPSPQTIKMEQLSKITDTLQQSCQSRAPYDF